ncbi:Putative trans-acting enoyl reductase [Corynebacterium kalinowskii]|uniref:Trans-acting enoyl reductase n=2 Tax=Corynebacterium kalinowskii TaxID=2675216 RepID=A0A6B8VCA6_9CORY|nr:Putative trans-acting enoyl reductase [Corynebacterium kalinowskii]
MTTLADMKQTYDIVLFGATSFVGRLTADYLAQHHSDLRIAIAGRNWAKLQNLRLPFTPLRADAANKQELDQLARSAKVIISTVGPYTRYGDYLVDACAESGTHYVDLCGEALFIRRIIDRWHGKTDSKIVHSCGFDSVPSDMGMFNLWLKSGRSTFREVVMAVDKLQGGLSGGTIDSMREVSQDAKRMPKGGAILHSPYSLSPDHTREPDLGAQPDLVAEYVPLLKQWAGPFFMAMFNTRVVRRSNALSDYRYGDQLRYREVTPTGEGVGGQLKAKALLGAIGAGFATIMTEPLRKPLSRIIPEPGEGPKNIDEGGFVITHHGVTTDGRYVSGRVSAEGDPGYKVTAMMLAEAAVTLATAPQGLPAATGVLTPATGLGEPYLAALKRNGMAFG